MMLALTLAATTILEHPIIIKLTSTTLILLIGFIAGKVLGLLIKRTLHQFNVDRGLSAATGHHLPVERQISTMISVLIYIIAILIAINNLGVLKHLLIIIGGLFLLIILISLLLACKDAIPNLIARLSNTYPRKGQPGDSITIRGIQGELVKKGLFTTTVREGQDHLRIPNRLFTKEDHTLTRKNRRRKKPSRVNAL